MVISDIGKQVHAQQTTEPHVLFSYDVQHAVAEAKTSGSFAEAPPAPLPDPQVIDDPAVKPATQLSPADVVAPAESSRRLAPRLRGKSHAGENETVSPRVGRLPFEIPFIDSLGTAGAGLVLVIGLFLLCIALMRRGGPQASSLLPRDAVAVLGRVPLAPKQFAHLLQVGNKLVLVSISGDRTDTITEITERTEVERLLSLCMKGNKQSSSAEFQKMLQQLAREPAQGFLGREAGNLSSRG